MKILVVEDDILIAEHLKEIIEAETEDLVEMVFTAKEALELLSLTSFDLLILDINMEKAESGIDLALEIDESYKIPFLFVTAQSDRQIVGRAVSLLPIAFIVKPFNSVSIIAAINLARISMQNDQLIFRDGYKEFVVRKQEIVYGKACNNYIEIYGLKKKWLVRNTMQNLMLLLPKEDFIQIHRSYFVNKNHVESVTSSKLVIKGIVIPISKGFENDARRLWNIQE